MREQCEQETVASKKLFADEMRNDATPVWMRAVLPKIKALPRAKHQRSLCKWNRDVDRRERGPNVRRHVIFTFGRMLENAIAVWHETREEALEIAPHFRVGVLLDDERSRGVLHVQRRLPDLKFGLREKRADLIGEFVETAPARCNRDLVLGLAQHWKAIFYCKSFSNCALRGWPPSRAFL
jgi:hypothetical protein